MREIDLNGYIDEEVWFGDEITPEALHEALYGPENKWADDVHIRLNSYGGSCNAAVRMYDDIRAYPGHVSLTISGTAASAATVLAMAADVLEMTPGSLFMIHDPSVMAWGNTRDLQEAISLLDVCKESILNVYAVRCQKERADVADMMTHSTWMDAKKALDEGFIDSIHTVENCPTNAAAPHAVDRKAAEAKVKAWLERRAPKLSRPDPGEEHTSAVAPVTSSASRPDQSSGTALHEKPAYTGVPAAQLQKRLGLLMPTKR